MKNSKILILLMEHLNKEILIDQITTLSTTYTDTGKYLKIAKSCQNNCTIAVTFNWLQNPLVRSYDVIGAYLDSVSLLSTPQTIVTSTTANSSSSEINQFSNGFGVSVALTLGNSLVISQTYTVSTGGHVYASYQHAKSVISLANSKNYTISRSGYGGVFNFSGTAANVYDQMQGVDITT